MVTKNRERRESEREREMAEMPAQHIQMWQAEQSGSQRLVFRL